LLEHEYSNQLGLRGKIWEVQEVGEDDHMARSVNELVTILAKLLTSALHLRAVARQERTELFLEK